MAPGLSYVPQLAATSDGLVLPPRADTIEAAFSRATLAFPGRQAVELAAALVEQLRPDSDPERGVRRLYGLTVAAGTVRVRSTVVADDRRDLTPEAPSLAEQMAQAECARAARAFVMADYAGRRAIWRWNQYRWAAEVNRRGIVSAWSSKSRMRMVETLASLDWSPVVDAGAGFRPAMVTLTMPGDWLQLAPTGADFKRLLFAFWKRWDRSPWAVTWRDEDGTERRGFRGVWKLEFQRRGAPHVHIYAAVPTDPAFRLWLSDTWYEVVGSGDERHRRAGTGVDWGEGIRASDPKRLAVYFAGRAIGHNVKGEGKEYQHRVPEQWQADGCGRFWGYKRLDRIAVDVPITRDQFVQLKRLMRSTVKARGLRVPRSMRSSRGGAVLLANDGPGWLSQAARFGPVGSAGSPGLRWRTVEGVGLVDLDTGEVASRARGGVTSSASSLRAWWRRYDSKGST